MQRITSFNVLHNKATLCYYSVKISHTCESYQLVWQASHCVFHLYLTGPAERILNAGAESKNPSRRRWKIRVGSEGL